MTESAPYLPPQKKQKPHWLDNQTSGAL